MTNTKKEFTAEVLKKYGMTSSGYFTTDTDSPIPWCEWSTADEAIEYAWAMYEIAFKKIGPKVFILKDFRE